MTFVTRRMLTWAANKPYRPPVPPTPRTQMSAKDLKSLCAMLF